METKICSKCKREMEATTENFYKSKTGVFGLYNYCKVCAKKTREERYQKHGEHDRLKSNQWKEANRDRARKLATTWNKKNAGKKNAATMKRHAAKLRATPKWADLKAIEAIYEECDRITKETGIEHNVDHICALQSKIMCGLHVEYNLQILTKKANCAKGNR